MYLLNLDGFFLAGHDAKKIKEQFNILKFILGALMLRRTKYMLMESGSLVLPPLTEITLLVHQHSHLYSV